MQQNTDSAAIATMYTGKNYNIKMSCLLVANTSLKYVKKPPKQIV